MAADETLLPSDLGGDISDRSIETVFENLLGLRRLAVYLVRDHNAADDLVQQECLSYIEKQRGSAETATPNVSYLRGMLRRLAARYFRDRSRRERREQRVAAEERCGVDSTEALSRAEIKQQMAQALFSLPELYRRALLLRFFEDWTPAQIAKAENVSVKAIYSRLERGLEKIRIELDRGQDRDQWVHSFLPWIAASPLAMTELGSAATSGWGASGSAAITTQTVTVPGIASGLSKTLGIGGIFMAAKATTATAAVALIVGLGVGFGTHPLFVQQGDEAPPKQLQELTDQLTAERQGQIALKDRTQELASANEELKTANQRLKVEIDEARKLLETANNAIAARDAAEAPSPMPIGSDSFEDNEALANADWEELAGATEEMNILLTELLENMANGGGMTPEQQIAIGRANGKLQKFALDLAQSLPTRVTGNGEFTHPVAASNLAATMLKRAGKPLSKSQKNRWKQATERYNRELEQREKEYSDDTFELTRILDEMESKLGVWEEFEEVLSAEQSGALFNPEIRHRNQLDVLSPVIMTIMLTQPPLAEPNTEVLVTKFKTWFSAQLALGEDESNYADLLQQAVEGWQQDLQEPLETPVPAAHASSFVAIDALIAGRAYERALGTLYDALPSEHPTRDRILALQTWRVPRLMDAPIGG